MLLQVRWPAPQRVRTFSTTRLGGVSVAPFTGLNLSTSTGDQHAAVAQNITLLARAAGLPHTPAWPRQVHGTRAVEAAMVVDPAPEADAVFTSEAGRVCSVRTADCLPVLLCDREGSSVAAVHAGWRGLAAGVLEHTISSLPSTPERLMAWLGPAIGPLAFEVGLEVREAFLDADPGAAACFQPSPAGRWLADLYALARLRLERAGVSSVHGGGLCTRADARLFFSYRRDGVTGRLASGIWIDPGA